MASLMKFYRISGLAAAKTNLCARSGPLLPSQKISKSAWCSPRNAAPISWRIHSPCLLYCNISILSVMREDEKSQKWNLNIFIVSILINWFVLIWILIGKCIKYQRDMIGCWMAVEITLKHVLNSMWLFLSFKYYILNFHKNWKKYKKTNDEEIYSKVEHSFRVFFWDTKSNCKFEELSCMLFHGRFHHTPTFFLKDRIIIVNFAHTHYGKQISKSIASISGTSEKW